MQIAPVYDRPIVTVEGGPAIAPAMVRQRRRLIDLLSRLSDEQWAAPSRCEEWRVQDVAAHLAGVDAFWTASISAGLAGSPTEFLRGFDPRATPAAMVASVAGKPPAETLAELSAATNALCDLVDGLDDDALSKLAESPPGHVAISDLLHHALWDAWIHERDIALPLDLSPDTVDDEVMASIEAFVEKYDLDLIPNVIDVEGSIRSDLGVVGQPHWLFITADGKRQKVFGEISDGGLTERLDALLEG